MFARWLGVRTVAAAPALGLLAGSALGLIYPDLPRPVDSAVLILCAAATLWGRRRAHAAALMLAVAGAFAGGGALLVSSAWQKAWRPSLRVAFEELGEGGARAGGRRASSAAPGR